MVKQGYKQTEIGVIPEDWEVKELVDMVELINGRAYSQNELLSRGKYRVLRVGNFFSSDKWYWSDLELSNKFYVENGDLMYAWSASFGPKFWFDEKTIYHYHIWKIDNYRKTDKKFLYHLLVNDKASIQNESQGGTMFHITKEAMEKRKFPLPPLPEQEAIAEALSDADAWIESLEQLIAKKRLIKQGAMQELLTPKEDWEVKKIREIAKVGRGRVISHKEINGSQMKKYPVYSSQTTNNGVMGYIDTYDFEGEYVTWTTDGEKAGTVFHRVGRFNCTNVCGTILLIKDNPKFISYILGTITPKHVSRNLANPKLMNEPMKNIELSIPSLSEQTRIATILSDMDAELEALERQLGKARQIKQGMMQELLTGRIRL